MHLLAKLGIRDVIITSASSRVGNCDVQKKPTAVGDLLMVKDTVISEGIQPLQWFPAPDAFIDRTNVYDQTLGQYADASATTYNLPLKHGYLKINSWPQFESPREIETLKKQGIHAVGMSWHETLALLYQYNKRKKLFEAYQKAKQGLDTAQETYDTDSAECKTAQ